MEDELRIKYLKTKLCKWEFTSALSYLDGEDKEIVYIIQVLAKAFDDSGWFSGEIGVIIELVVDNLLNKLEPAKKPLTIDQLGGILKETLEGNDNFKVEFDNKLDEQNFLLDLVSQFKDNLSKFNE